ncbi:hypothetical protein [Pseudomonas viridiflava]|uniref:hypothetical protein n=1 Tax=Pseudomonas viridiflava TaxID=33069 RepID=UPI000F0383C5|nr:hypothetical protein [Pseudomonas viridiflava]
MNLKGISKHIQSIIQLFENAGSEFHPEWSTEEHFIINNFIALPVFELECSINAEEDIDINDEHGNLLGVLCPTGATGDIYSVNELSAHKLNAFIHDIDDDQFGLSQSHNFKSHYLLIHKDFITRYVSDFLESAPIWGGFTHKPRSPRYKKSITKIVMSRKMFTPTIRHNADLEKAISAANGFDRFLKYYHQLELLFDVIFVSKVRGLPKHSIEGFSNVVKDYQKKELESLKGIFKDYATDSKALLSIMASCTPYTTTMEAVFQDHSKDGNPVTSDQTKWANLLIFLQGNDHTHSKAKQLSLISKDTSNSLDQFILNLTAYWIYRIRCSIAHNKIGEFMFSDSHEEFIVEIGEKLLKEVIMQIFSNNALESILSS